MIPAANGPEPGDVRERRRRDDPDDVDVDPQARRPGDDGGHEHVPGAPRVLAHDDRAARSGQAMRDRPAEGVGGGRAEVDVGDPADPIGAEQAGHGRQPPDGAGEALAGADDGGRDGDRDGHLGRAGRDERGPGRQVRRHGTAWAPALSPATSRSTTMAGPGQPVEVGGRAADRDQHAVGRQRVAQVGGGADEPEAGGERPGGGHRPDLDRDRDRRRRRRRRRRSAARAWPRPSRPRTRRSSRSARCRPGSGRRAGRRRPATRTTWGSTVTDRSRSRPPARR